MDIPKSEIERANRRGRARLRSSPIAKAARYDRGRIVIEMSTGLELSFKARDAQGLAQATPAQLREIEVTPTGLGLHFPQLDADIYLPALLDGFLGSKMWMARLGQRGGSVASPAKAAAARANGKLGGRPRKTMKETA